MSEFSFFNDLTNVSGDDFPATQLIKFLLQTIGHDVCTIKRNNLSSYQLVHNASKIYKVINDLIGAVDGETEDVWDKYDQYTEAIDPLESFLFKFALLAEAESKLWLFDKESIPDCIQFVDDWVKVRSQLQVLLKDLQKLPSAPTFDNAVTDNMQKHDDTTLLSVLCAAIEKHSLVDNRISNGLIAKVKSDAQSIPSKALNANVTSNSTCMSTKCTMLLHSVMEVSEKSPDKQVKAHLKSVKMWDKAKSLFSTLVSHLNNNAVVPFAKLEKEYEEFVKYLKNLPVGEVPSQYLALKKTMKTVMRPYHSRARELVSQCCALVAHFKDNRDATKLESLTTALTTAVAALNAAAEAMTVIGEHSEDIEKSKAALAFNTAEEKIEECFKTYNMTTWNTHAANMKQALAKDKERMVDLNARFKKGNTSNPGSGSIKLILKKANGDNIVTYQTEGTTILSAVLWKLAQGDRTLLQGRYFEQDAAGGKRQRIGNHEQAKNIRGSGSERTLYLV